MDEGWAASLSLIFAVAIVWFIHRMVTSHFTVQSDAKAILSMEVVVLGLLFSGFVLTEVHEVRAGLSSRLDFVGDSFRLFGALAASLLIYRVFTWKK